MLYLDSNVCLILIQFLSVFPASTSDVAVSFQSPVLGESASMCSNSQSHDTENFSQIGEIPDQRFYQELLVSVLTLPRSLSLL